MTRTRIKTDERASVGELLRNSATIGRSLWATAMARSVGRRDLQTLAWLLLHADRERRVPFTHRRMARY